MEVERLVVGPLRTNCYIVTDEEDCVLIDPGGNSDAIIRRLSERELEPKAILATHGHFDHILSVSALKTKYSRPFLISGRERAIIDGFTEFVKKYFGFDPGPPPEPDGLLENATTIKLGGTSIRVVETPGHTPGSCSFLVGDILFSGDFIFNGTIGRTDFGGSESEMKKSIDWIKALDSDLEIYPGHGEKTTLERERMMNPFLA